MVAKNKHLLWFRLHGVLEDFLPATRRGRWVPAPCNGSPAVKDPMEALGVPHSEVAAILVEGRAVDLTHRLHPDQRVELHPLGPWPVPAGPPLRPPMPRPPRFVVDVNLGQLARRLRLLGFDTAWRNDYADHEVVAIASKQNRVILTRDRRLLFRRLVRHGLWVRAVNPRTQAQEVVQRLQLQPHVRPFRRCLECNGPIRPVSKAAVLHRLEPLTRRWYDEFYRCAHCDKIYWKGSHFNRLQAELEVITDHADDPHPLHPPA